MRKTNLLSILLLFLFFSVSCQEDHTPDIDTEEAPIEITEDVNIEEMSIEGLNIEELMAREDLETRSILFRGKGLANKQYAKRGAYSVSTNAVLGDCKILAGAVVNIFQHIGLVDSSIKCNNSFPYGFSSFISSSVYYPTEIKKLGKLPIINFVGGILSNQGNYHEMIELWVSHGFIVVISSDFHNSLPEMHLLGMIESSKMNKDKNSPLYNKIDMSKMIIAGHSAGGQATLQVASIPEKLYSIIDPEIRIIGAMPIEPGPLALGSTVKHPTFILTGAADIIVPAWAWAKLLQSNLIKSVPMWTATATTATHFSPVLKVESNEFSGITVAWLKYIGKNDATAKSYFVGKNYLLAKDNQFIQSKLNPLRVTRNAKAEQLK